MGGLLADVKEKQKEEKRVIEAKEAFSSLDANNDEL